MTIIESSVWIDVLQGRDNEQTRWFHENRRSPNLALTDLILCEVLRGIGPDSVYEGVRKDLMKYVIFTTGGVELAVASATNYRRLRSRGITIRSMVDCVIATFCIQNGHDLLHHDRDFDPFEQYLGLKVIHS